MYRRRPEGPQVLLVHPGGPFWKNRDLGAWTIPKGEAEQDEDLLVTAVREFREEIGVEPRGPFVPLTPVKQKGGKLVHAWAVEGDLDATAIKSNTRSSWSGHPVRESGSSSPRSTAPSSSTLAPRTRR